MANKMKKSGVEWIGEIPEHWETLKLKYISTFQQNKYSSNDGNLNYVALENIESWNGKYVETKSVYDKEQALICEKGDVIFGKLRPYLAKVHISDKRQCCSGEFVVIRILPPQLNKFFWYQFISHGFIFMIDKSTYGTKMPRANVDFIKNVSVVLPPENEQQKIVAFLDAQCACLDSVLEKTRATIDEYKKLKQALITQAVTKGIRGARQMKDSGIEWIGEIPKDWSVVKIKNISSVCTGNSIKDELKEQYSDSVDAIPYISTKDVDSVFQKIEYENGMFVKKEDSSFKRANAFSTLLCIEGGSAGKKIAFTNQEVCFVNKLCNFYCENDNNRYLYYYLSSYCFLTLFNSYISGLIGGVSVGNLKNFTVVRPPLDEQTEIAPYLDRQCAKIDAIIAKKQQYLIEIENYKKSLIYETTTGKREVK